jgi:hypothetical protein
MANVILTSMLRAFTVAAVLMMVAPAKSADLPDAKMTPGVTRTDLTTDQVCHTKWGKDHRAVTAAMKRQVFENYGLSGNHDPACKTDKHGRHFEIDHLISRELAGADDVDNLWPQCYGGLWNAVMKDRLENRLHKLVCDGTLTLKEAQTCISADWIACYKEHLTP